MCLYCEIQVFENVYCAEILTFTRAMKKILIVTGTISKDLRKYAQVTVLDCSLHLFQNSVIHVDLMCTGICFMSSLKIHLVWFCQEFHSITHWGMRVGVIRGLLALACIYFEVRGSSECNLYDESVRSWWVLINCYGNLDKSKEWK